MENRHILLLTFPAIGHINPSLQFANRLLKMGIQVTFATSLSAYRRISTTATVAGLTFATFSDGYDDGFNIDVDNPNHLISEFRDRGSQAIKEIITESAKQGRHISCLVYTLLLPWAARVARELHVRSALLWVEPALVFDICYYYFNGYDEIISTKSNDPSCPIQLPGLPPLKARDVPSFLLPSDSNKFALHSFKEQVEILDEEENPVVLVNTFDALEAEALRAIPKYKMYAIGPLTPPMFFDGRDPSKNSSNYMEFLSSKQESSVVYISFGSVLVVNNTQMEEIAQAVLKSKRPFLWVIRDCYKDNAKPNKYMEELEKQGMLVPWCSQLEVLTHPSVGCFVTHCGWNSTLESLTCGMPVVAFPHNWMDQGTNAKLIEDVWRTGVRVKAREGDGMVESGEISRCIEIVMGGVNKGDEFKRNAIKWKALAREAIKDGGFVDENLKGFVEGLFDNGKFTIV